MPELKDMFPTREDPLVEEDRELVNEAVELERQCAFLSNQLNDVLIKQRMYQDCLETVRSKLMEVKTQIKDRSLSPHYRKAMYGYGLMKGL